MAADHPQKRGLHVLVSFASLVLGEVHAASKQKPCWAVLALGLGNLLAGLAFGSGDWLPTFAVLDVVYANFAWAPWLVAAYLGAQRPMALSGFGLAAKTTAVAVVAGAMVTVAGLAAMAWQCWKHPAALDLPIYVAGVYANLGLSVVHIAMLAVAMRAITGRRWLSLALTAGLWTATNLGFDHPLLRFGGPVSPASGMNGFGPFLVPSVAAGIHWTAFCIVLLATGHWLAGRRCAKAGGPPWHPPGRDAFALVWTAAVAWLVSGGWILHRVDAEKFEGGDFPGSETRVLDTPSPVYSRLALDITISPLERVLVSRGTAITVNRTDVPIHELAFGIPRTLQVDSLTLTGEPVATDIPGADGSRYWRYRLNRPLEPKETLKIEFGLTWVARDFANDRRNTQLAGNGTFASTADIVPALGDGNPSWSTAPVVFRARISTSLDQIAVTAGTLVRTWKENGWSFYEYASQGPIPPFITIHSGHYAVAREAGDEGTLEVFYHPPHRPNVDRMLDAGRAALARQAGGPATGSDLAVRVVEVPGYRPFRRLGILGFGNNPPPREAAPGLVVPYSERGYPINTPPPNGSTRPRA